MKCKDRKKKKAGYKVSYESKKLKRELCVILLCGVFFLALGLGLLFGMYRPQIPWQKIHCTEAEGTLEFVNGSKVTCLYRYNIDGVDYEVVVQNYKSSTRGIPLRWIENVYVNRNNPNEAKSGSLGGEFLAATLVFIAAGIGTIYFAIHHYFAEQKKLKHRR